jgi:hypothetical protein
MDPTTQRLASAALAPPAQITFTADNYYPSANQSVLITWSVVNAASVNIDQGVGSVGPSGSINRSEDGVSRTYTLQATGLDGLMYSANITISWGPSCVWALYGRPEWC